MTSVATNTHPNNKQLPDYSASPDVLLDLLDFLKSGDRQLMILTRVVLKVPNSRYGLGAQYLTLC